MLKKIISILMTSIIMCCFAIPVSASETAIEENFDMFAEIKSVVLKLNNEDDYIITGKVFIKEDIEIPSEVNIYIRNGGSLVIKENADVTMAGTMTIERGGKLYVTDGAFSSNGVFNNFGKLIVRENGVFNSSSSFYGNAGSKISLEGEANFGALSLGKAVKIIKKYDSKFNLKNYCIISRSCETPKKLIE